MARNKFLYSTFPDLMSKVGILPLYDQLFGGYSQANVDYINRINEILASDPSKITSRDQIIDPYAYLDSSLYRNTSKGQALYKEHLDALVNLKNMQEAAYKEFYDSPVQQVARDNEAGINSALTGVEADSSAQAESPQSSPFDGVPTNLEAINSVSSLVGSVASVAALPFSIGSSIAQMSMSSAQKGLVAAQTAGQQIANVSAFEGSVYAAMAANLADAVGSAASSGTKFDFDKWINDPASSAGIFESYAPEDNSRYRAAFDRAKKNLIRVKGSAYALNANAVGQQSHFAEGLSNPYYDPDLLVQVAGLEPTMDAIEKIRVAKEKYFDKVRITKEEYIANLDPAAIAEADVDKAVSEATKADFEALTAELNYIIQNAQQTIRMNYMDIYKQNPNSLLGLTGAYMIMDNMPMKYTDWLAAHGVNLILNHNDKRPFVVNPNPGSSLFPQRDSTSVPAWQKNLPPGFSFGD